MVLLLGDTPQDDRSLGRLACTSLGRTTHALTDEEATVRYLAELQSLNG